MYTNADRHYIRGTALVETALVIPIFVTLLLTLIAFTIFSLEQIHLDGAAAMAAHEKIYHPTRNEFADAAGIFPLISDASTNQTTYSLNYTGATYVKGSNPFEYYISKSQSFNIPFYGPLSISLLGIGTEYHTGLYLNFPENNGQVQVANDDEGITPTLRAENSMQECNDQEGVSTSPQDFPMPYAQPPPALPAAITYPLHWTYCPDTPNGSRQTFSVHPLGLAFRLDFSNTSRPYSGLTPSNLGDEGNGLAFGSTFWEVLYHQSVMSQAIVRLQTQYGPMPTNPVLHKLWVTKIDTDPSINEIYSWDISQYNFFTANVTRIAVGSH